MTSESSDDPYRVSDVEDGGNPPVSTAGPGEMLAIIVLAAVLGLFTFFATCIGIGLGFISVYGLYGPDVNGIEFIPWVLGGVAGSSAAFLGGRAMFRRARNRRSRMQDGGDAHLKSPMEATMRPETRSSETNS